ncbi:MAG: hypothetical protein K2Q23_03905 [Bryobacteraceae bacterium]|nr:hypothetical protein [Bryobacteraceae bacterium]
MINNQDVAKMKVSIPEETAGAREACWPAGYFEEACGFLKGEFEEPEDPVCEASGGEGYEAGVDEGIVKRG